MRTPDADRSPPGGHMAMVIRDVLRKFVTDSVPRNGKQYTIRGQSVKAGMPETTGPSSDVRSPARDVAGGQRGRS